MRTVLNARLHFAWAVSCCLVISLTGCGGSGPRVYHVSGVLTHNGSPLPKMAVTFQPVDGSRPSYGETDADGRFQLRYSGTKDGALEGEHIVFVEPIPEGEQGMAYLEGHLKLKGTIGEVVAKYGTKETSPYRVTIDGNVKDLEIKLD